MLVALQAGSQASDMNKTRNAHSASPELLGEALCGAGLSAKQDADDWLSCGIAILLAVRHAVCCAETAVNAFAA